MTLPLEKTKSGSITIKIIIHRSKTNVALSKIDNSQYQKIDRFGFKFTPVVPTNFKLVSSQNSQYNNLITCEGPEQNASLKELEALSISGGNIAALGFDLSREILVTTMMKMHESVSNKVAKGTYQVLEKDLDVTQSFAVGKYKKALRYKWKFTNADLKLITVTAIIGLSSIQNNVMNSFVYSTSKPEVSEEKMNMINECALQLTQHL